MFNISCELTSSLVCSKRVLFSCEFCEISKNTFFKEHLRSTASDIFI